MFQFLETEGSIMVVGEVTMVVLPGNYHSRQILPTLCERTNFYLPFKFLLKHYENGLDGMIVMLVGERSKL